MSAQLFAAPDHPSHNHTVWGVDDIAAYYNVTPACVKLWVKAGIVPPPTAYTGLGVKAAGRWAPADIVAASAPVMRPTRWVAKTAKSPSKAA